MRKLLSSRLKNILYMQKPAGNSFSVESRRVIFLYLPFKQ